MEIEQIDRNYAEMARRLGANQDKDYTIDLGGGIRISIEKGADGLALGIIKVNETETDATLLHYVFIEQSKLNPKPIGYFEGKPIYSKDELPDEVKAHLDDLLTAKI